LPRQHGCPARLLFDEMAVRPRLVLRTADDVSKPASGTNQVSRIFSCRANKFSSQPSEATAAAPSQSKERLWHGRKLSSQDPELSASWM
uniref:Uncharacterized protein n=1 Tax=Aegilops tauschii subsp. strangulata TaxID=200361 RepID=A0A452ZH52_AEGTS